MADEDLNPKEVEREPAEVLREQDELFRALTQHANDLLCLNELDGRSVYASPSVERLYGRKPTKMFEFAYPEDVEHCQRWWRGAVAGGTERLHWRARDNDGQWRWLETSAARVQYHNKPQILTVCRDVTERRLTEQELGRTTTLLRAVIDGTTDAVFVKDRGGRYLLCNAAAAQFLGRTVSEVLENDDSVFFDPVSAKVVKDHDERVMKSGVANTEEEELTVGAITRIVQVTKRHPIGTVAEMSSA
ncbi:aerobic respiration control sensor protein ArcB [Anatilimnocola aggregata]|uniref:histidine kinase n=1 Tax=Anatilimnocola aggregata TaxID=2528021 RepID=A0A517Y540_9BACT|nr:PAS domain S-box protein [Anatilimnocola aggregata]QDU25316.1 aerobic respiration control sensor protein ArcB [Anatilimnocola aggregata]